MRILFVTQNLPYPVNSGSRLRTANLIRLLTLDHEVQGIFLPFRGMDIEAFVRESPPSLDYRIVQPRKRTRIGRGYEYITAPLFKRPEVLDGLRNIVLRFKPEVVWLDYLFLGQYITWFTDRNIPVIYGTHNAQSNLTRQQALAERKFRARLKFSLMARLHAFHEWFFFRRARSVVCVSERDREFHSKFVKHDRLFVVPNFVDMEAYSTQQPHVDDYPYICFVGSIDNFQNAQGVKFFISRIWDKVSASVDAHLLVIGRGASRDRELQTLVSHYKNIKVLENVDSVVPFIKGSMASIVPLLQGSGTRLKIIESMACKSAIVSTSLGAEGIGAVNGKDILIADEPDEFARQVVRVIRDNELRKALGENAYQFASKRFGLDTVRSMLQPIVAG